ncbi:hypothetical protein AAZX31_12G118900 [Glycine max]
MGFRLPGIRKALFAANLASSKAVDTPKGHLAVYVAVCDSFIILEPIFIPGLVESSEEFGYDHSMGGLTIPCSEDVFQCVTSYLN